jgi:hypothetical protein
MPAINFQSRFAPLVKSGQKRQTIRANGKRRPPRPGENLFLYTGQRQSGCVKLGEAICTRVTPISISARQKHISMPSQVTHSWQLLTPEEMDVLAIADGFTGAAELFQWIQENHGDTLSGNLIEW